MEIKIITGMSGAGKTTMSRYFEDLGYSCHDNFPANLILSYITGKEFNKIVFIVDTRTENDFTTLLTVISDLKKININFSMIYLDCNDEVLINRYREEKKLHHFQIKDKISLIDAIQKERSIVEVLKNKSDYVFDTSNLTNETLLNRAKSIFNNESNESKLMITCISFGFKYGTPRGVDMLYDVRSFKNPYWIPELRNKTGIDKEVSNYILSFDESKEFIDKIYDMVDFLIPIYIRESKRQLNIAFGCTGGHHRSVCFAECLYKHLQDKNLNVIIKHINIKDE